MNQEDLEQLKESLNMSKELMDMTKNMMADTVKRLELTGEFVSFMSQYDLEDIKTLPDETISSILDSFHLTNHYKEDYQKHQKVLEKKPTFSDYLKTCGYENEEELSQDEKKMLESEYEEIYREYDGMESYNREMLYQLYRDIISYLSLVYQYEAVSAQVSELNRKRNEASIVDLLSLMKEETWKKIIDGEDYASLPVNRKYNRDYIEGLFKLQYLKDYVSNEFIQKRLVQNFFDKRASNYLMERVKEIVRRLNKKKEYPINSHSIQILFSHMVEEAFLPESYYCYNGFISFIFLSYLKFNITSDSSKRTKEDGYIISFIRLLHILYDTRLLELTEITEELETLRSISIQNFIEILDTFSSYKDQFETYNILHPESKERIMLAENRRKEKEAIIQKNIKKKTEDPVDRIFTLFYEDEELRQVYINHIKKFEESEKEKEEKEKVENEEEESEGNG